MAHAGRASATTTVGSINDSSATLTIGASQSGSPYANGLIDEMRISNVVRSFDWLQTTWNNLSVPANFYTISSATSLSVAFVTQVGAFIVGP
jgi:hypothetical protein